MKKSMKISIVLIALLLIVAAICGVIFTNAKYTTTLNGSATASVAKWVFNVTGNDSYADADTLTGLKIAQTCTPETLVDGKIAPGTSGSFDIVVNTQDAEVGVKYDVTFVEAASKVLPTNLKMTLDGAEWTPADGIHGTINANADSKEVTHTVAWTWAYETPSGDVADTADGVASLDYTYTVTAIGTQVQPIAQ